MHCNFGIDLINTIKLENPRTCGLPNFGTRIREHHDEEQWSSNTAYAEDTMPRGVLGLNAAMFKEYLRFIANRRCQQIGLDALLRGRATEPVSLDGRDDRPERRRRTSSKRESPNIRRVGVLSWD